MDQKIAVSILLVGSPGFGIVGMASYSLFTADPGSLFLPSRLKTELKHPSQSVMIGFGNFPMVDIFGM